MTGRGDRAPLTATPDRRALDAFDAWLDDAPAERDGNLARRLGDQPDLLGRVRRLIRSHRDAAALPTEPPAPATPAAPRAWPVRIGPYRIAGVIAEGGMGRVFRGERDDGLFDHAVAIKLIRRTLFAGAAADQFAVERQILARLRHPHIAQLFDGGVTADGDPYIVMELIDGQAIGDHCAAARLDRRARVALVRAVCDAVQFAHQNLIVHADIKPGNIMVDPAHGVKLLDFGIARLLGAARAAPADSARTPGFASPARLSGAAAVPADDIFALGRVAAALIDDGTPPPSQLAAVIARATALDPATRYPTVEAFAADLDRWVRGVPVRALPAPPARVATMFVGRHPFASAATAAAVVGLVVATVVTTTLYVRAERARHSAEQRFDEVRALSRYLLTDLTDRLEGIAGTTALRHELAAKGRNYLEALGRVPDAPRDLRLEVARGYVATGRIAGQPGLQSLGDAALAKRDLVRAEAILDRLDDDPATELARSQLLTARAQIVHVTDNHPADALGLYRTACALAARVAARHPSPAARLARARCLLGVANIDDYEARYTSMRPVLDELLAVLAGRGLPAVDAAQLRGNALILYGDVDYYAGDREQALADYRAAVAALASGSDRDAPDLRLLERFAWAEYNLAAELDDMHRPAEALPALDRGIAAADLTLTFEKSPRSRHMANILHMQRAVILGSLRRYDEAIAAADAALAAIRATAAQFPHDFEAARSVPVNRRPVGDLYRAAGRPADACREYRATAAEWHTLAQARGVLGSDTTDELKQLAGLLRHC